MKSFLSYPSLGNFDLVKKSGHMFKSNYAFLICGLVLLVIGLSDIKKFNILYDGFAIFIGIVSIVLFFVNLKKRK